MSALACGCRPADTWCSQARRLRGDVDEQVSTLELVSPKHLAQARADLGAAERALRDHLAPRSSPLAARARATAATFFDR